MSRSWKGNRTWSNTSSRDWIPSSSETTLPSISITYPTSTATYNNGNVATITIAGIASDNVGISNVTWVNNFGGSGTATGTTSWTASNIALSSGQNIITVTAHDIYGNINTDSLIVTYTPSDTTYPTCTITNPTTNSVYDNGSVSTIALSGTAYDAVGVSTVTWTNSRGGSGTAVGTTSWVIPSIQLYSGQNYITITCYDASNNTGTDSITVTYSSVVDYTNPSCAITSPTNEATYNNGSTSTINLSGTSSDNVGVSYVSWSNNRGGSGTATGTSFWSKTNIQLYSGTNIITITAHDAAGNTGLTTITVTYTPQTAGLFYVFGGDVCS